MKDQHFTPPNLIAAMLTSVHIKNVTLVADFAAGDGDLLDAAARRWPKAAVVATDIDYRCVNTLKRTRRKWSVSKCDFLKSSSRRTAKAIVACGGLASLILLNPPFTCRGSTRHKVAIGDLNISCSKAMAFVANALRYMAPGGELIAILPMSCKTSEKDACAWRIIRQIYDVRWTRTFDRNAFPNVVVNTGIACIRKKTNTGVLLNVIHTDVDVRHDLTIVRGTLPMHVATGLSRGRFPLIHSTNLQRGQVVLAGRHVVRKGRTIAGPAVLLPRVGEPSIAKCAVYADRKPVILSDCVYGIQVRTLAEAKRMQQAICDSWKEVERLYTGSCAKYLTLRSLHDVVSRIRDRARGRSVYISRDGIEVSRRRVSI